MQLKADVVVHVKGGIAYVVKLPKDVTAVVIDEDSSGDEVFVMKRGTAKGVVYQTAQEKVKGGTRRELTVRKFLDSFGEDAI